MKRRTKKLLIVLVVVPALLAGAGFAAHTYRQARLDRIAQESYVRGKAAYEAGNHAQAMPLIARYVGRNRDDTAALVMLADCRARVPKPEGTELVDAARYADHAIAIDPTYEPALDLLLDYYARLGFVTELNTVCDLMLDLHPDHGQAIRAKVQALMALGRYDDARQIAERLAALEPTSVDPIRVLLEIRRLQGGSLAEIASQAGELVASNPESFEMCVIHAQALMNAANMSAAAVALERASELTPRSLRSVDDALRLADAIAMMQRVAQPDAVAEAPGRQHAAARTILDRAAANPELRAGVVLLAAAWEWRKAQLPAAIEWIERGMTTTPDDPAMLGWRAVFARDQREDWQASVAAVRTAESETMPLWSTLLTAISEADQSRWQQARVAANEALALSDQRLGVAVSTNDAQSDYARISAAHVRSLALLHSGNVESETGDWRLAVQRWTTAGELEPNWSLPLVTAANVLLENGQVRTGFDMALRAFGVRPGPYEAITLARAAITRQEIEGGAFDPAISMMPLLAELEAMDQLRADAVALRLRAAVARRDQPAVSAAAADLLATGTESAGRLFADAARRIRSAAMSGWEPLLAAAEQAGATSDTIIFRANGAADAGRRDEALLLLRQAAAERSGEERLPFRFAEARLLVRFNATDDARTLLRAISDEHPDSARVQSEILQFPIAWTEAPLVDSVVQRLRQATGDAGIEWKLADATRVLTFTPDQAKAQEVVVRLTQIITEDPRNTHALALLSDWMVVLGDTPSAIGYLSRAVDTADAPPALYPKLIELLRQDGRSADARVRLLAFAEVRTLEPALRRQRARLLTEFSMYSQAARDFEILAAEGTELDRLAYAQALVGQRELERAADVLVPLMEASTLPRDLFMTASGLLIDAGDADQAIALFDRRAGDPSSGLTPMDRARTLEYARKFAEAETAFVAVAQSQNTADAWAEVVRFHQRRGQPERASQAVAEARSRGVTGPALDSAEAFVLAATQGALTDQQMQSVIDSIPAGPARELAEATRWFDANPDKIDEFITRLRTITRADPQLQLAWQFLVQTLADKGDFPGAVEAAQAAAAALPSSEVAARMEASTLLSMNRLSEARIAAARWRELEQDPFDPDMLRASIETLDGRREAALAILRPAAAQAVTRVGEMPLGRWSSLVAGLAAAGDTARARELAALRDPAEPGWVQIQAAIAGESAEPPEAARQWLAAIEPLLLTLERGSLTLAQAHASLGGRTKEAADFEKALSVIMPDISAGKASPFAKALAAGMLEELSRHSEAVAMYQAAIREDPELWIALNNLAYLAVEQGLADLDPITLATKALEIAERQRVPGQVLSQVHHTLAQAQLASGKTAEALASVRRGIVLSPQNGSVRLAEIEVIVAMGDTARAASTLGDLDRRSEAGLVTLDDADREKLQTLRTRIDGGG